jgi:hypothetical protein
MDECWSAKGNNISASYRQLVSVLAGEAQSKKADLLIYCDSEQQGLRSELERLGFLPRFQIIRYKCLSRFRHESVLLPPTDTVRLSQVA